MPTPVVPLDLPRDTINVLLLGSDSRPGEKLGRTDTIIVASINPKANYVSLLSIPRDLYVFIPGLNQFDRINTVDIQANRAKIGKPVELLAETIRYNLGIPVHYYARINFSGVREMIDRVGGVDVLAHCPLYDVFPDLPPDQNDIITDTVAVVHRADGHDRYSGAGAVQPRRPARAVVCALALFHQRLRSLAPAAGGAARAVEQDQSAGAGRSTADVVE